MLPYGLRVNSRLWWIPPLNSSVRVSNENYHVLLRRWSRLGLSHPANAENGPLSFYLISHWAALRWRTFRCACAHANKIVFWLSSYLVNKNTAVPATECHEVLAHSSLLTFHIWNRVCERMWYFYLVRFNRIYLSLRLLVHPADKRVLSSSKGWWRCIERRGRTSKTLACSST